MHVTTNIPSLQMFMKKKQFLAPEFSKPTLSKITWNQCWKLSENATTVKIFNGLLFAFVTILNPLLLIKISSLNYKTMKELLLTEISPKNIFKGKTALSNLKITVLA